MKLSFHGADRSVTGSCHLIECAGKRILIDCGLYQGGRELDEENSHAFGFDPADVDYVLLTHAHLDHCGRLPLLAKKDSVVRSLPRQRLENWVGLCSSMPLICKRMMLDIVRASQPKMEQMPVRGRRSI